VPQGFGSGPVYHFGFWINLKSKIQNLNGVDQHTILIKQTRKLHSSKQREQGVFLLEGTHLLEEACAVLPASDCVFYTRMALTINSSKLVDRLNEQNCQSEVLKAIATSATRWRGSDGKTVLARARCRLLVWGWAWKL